MQMVPSRALHIDTSKITVEKGSDLAAKKEPAAKIGKIIPCAMDILLLLPTLEKEKEGEASKTWLDREKELREIGSFTSKQTILHARSGSAYTEEDTETLWFVEARKPKTQVKSNQVKYSITHMERTSPHEPNKSLNQNKQQTKVSREPIISQNRIQDLPIMFGGVFRIQGPLTDAYFVDKEISCKERKSWICTVCQLEEQQLQPLFPPSSQFEGGGLYRKQHNMQSTIKPHRAMRK